MVEPAVIRHQQDSGAQHITRLLVACGNGDRTAFDQLVSLVYPEMREIAKRQLRRLRPGDTLATTDLVHEAYLKLVDQRLMQWKDRNHFYSIAACAMRQLLVDYTRRNMAGKRDGIVEPVNENHAAVTASHQFWLLALDQALKELETFDDSLPRVVECLLFAGLTQEETARVLGVSTPTVCRRWQRARAWLHAELYAQ